MPKTKYVERRFNGATRQVIDQANHIIDEYAAQGFDLTLRQLYYQFVARAILPNTVQSYKRLGGIISDARLAGLIDWDRITDRTRNIRALSHWSDPAEIIRACVHSFRLDKWGTQPYRVEVWIEKDALVGVFEDVCQELDVPLFSCRGYTSQSEVWSAGQRLRAYKRCGQSPVILHFGDHDPSGLDMTRDVEQRLVMFAGCAVDVKRLALTHDQVEEFDPPPNPAKETDARFAAYQQLHGDESWELDALDPATLAALVRDAVDELREVDAWETAVEQEEEARRLLKETSDRWVEVVDYLTP